MHPFLNIADKAARKAGKIILDGLERVDRIQPQQKPNHRGLVTETDIKAEKAIIDVILNAYPEHGIYAEESGMVEGKNFNWIIDPLDGTSNFIHSFPHFAISIAIKNLEKDCIEHAFIYDPLRQESFFATRGQGAYLNNTQRFIRRLRVSNRSQIEESLLGIAIPSRRVLQKAPPLNKEALRTMMSQASGIRRTGSAVLDLAYVAAGRLDAVLELCLEPWDIAAGMLLIKEAGGMVCDLKGGEAFFQTGHLIGGNAKLCTTLLSTIQI